MGATFQFKCEQSHEHRLVISCASTVYAIEGGSINWARGGFKIQTKDACCLL